MYPLAKEVQEYVLQNLYKLAVDKKYSLHPGVMLDCLFAAFEQQGVEVLFYKERSFFRRTLRIRAERTHSMLLQGHKKNPYSSLASLTESLEDILSNLYPAIDYPGLRPERAVTNEEYQKIVNEVEGNMSFIFYHDYLAKYQEHLFLPVTEKPAVIPQEPALFDDIIHKRHSDIMDEYKLAQRAIRRTGDQVLEKRKSELKKRIWAHYLVALAEMKGYPFVNKSVITPENKYQDVLKQDKAALMQGSEIFRSDAKTNQQI